MINVETAMDKITTPYFFNNSKRDRCDKPKYETLLKIRQFARNYKYFCKLNDLGGVILN